MIALLADSILDNHVLVICATVALLVLVSEIGCCTVRWHRDELDVGLKHEMLARGVPPDQIVQVLQASSSKRKQMEAFNQTVQYSPRAES